jgi:hypothetical protein
MALKERGFVTVVAPQAAARLDRLAGPGVWSRGIFFAEGSTPITDEAGEGGR